MTKTVRGYKTLYLFVWKKNLLGVLLEDRIWRVVAD